jgi:hypothetical protein
MQSKRQRLINMRECLRAVQVKMKAGEGSQFICLSAQLSNSNFQAKKDTCSLVSRAIDPYGTFCGWLKRNNRGRRYTHNQIMKLRIKWIDQLCHDISVEIDKTNIMIIEDDPIVPIPFG